METVMPKRIIQRATDPRRAKAAFELGVFSQLGCTPTLSEVLSSLRRDVPTVILNLLLGLLRHIDQLCSEKESSQNAGRDSNSWVLPQPKSVTEPDELRSRFAEVRELTDLAIPRFCELRPLFEFGQDVGALRRVLDELNFNKTDGAVTAKEIKIALTLEIPNIESRKALARFPEIEAIWERVRGWILNRNEIRQLMQDACSELETASVVSANEFLDAFIKKLRVSVCSVEFDLIAQDESKHARNAWLFDRAQKCPNCVLLAEALREKVATQPDGERWELCAADGIREALNSFASREGMPPIALPVGRPKSATPSRKSRS